MEVTWVEDFIPFIPSMDTFTEASTKASVQVTSVKASSTYAKTPITSMKAPVEAFVEVTSMKSFV